MSKEQKEKPKKKELGSRKLKMTWYGGGYNDACDDWEEYLATRPKIDVGEIENIIKNNPFIYVYEENAKDLSKAIAEYINK